MKRLIETKLFLSLQESSQKGIDIDAQVLENEYAEFVMHVFHESTTFTDRVAYHNTLVYTQVELKSLTEVSEKKCRNLFTESDRTCCQAG